MRVEVDPADVRFTQESIAVKFKSPYEGTRIDYAVDMIVSGKWSASEFPALEVVRYENEIWSLDNRRLWVFRKAKIKSIIVRLKNSSMNPRLLDLINNRELLNRMNSRRFLPKVRGKWGLKAINFPGHRDAAVLEKGDKSGCFPVDSTSPSAFNFERTNLKHEPTAGHHVVDMPPVDWGDVPQDVPSQDDAPPPEKVSLLKDWLRWLRGSLSFLAEKAKAVCNILWSKLLPW